MYWTEEHDRLMCREILAVDPFTGTKKGTVQRGAKWKITTTLTTTLTLFLQILKGLCSPQLAQLF